MARLHLGRGRDAGQRRQPGRGRRAHDVGVEAGAHGEGGAGGCRELDVPRRHDGARADEPPLGAPGRRDRGERLDVGIGLDRQLDRRRCRGPRPVRASSRLRLDAEPAEDRHERAAGEDPVELGVGDLAVIGSLLSWGSGGSRRCRRARSRRGRARRRGVRRAPPRRAARRGSRPRRRRRRPPARRARRRSPARGPRGPPSRELGRADRAVLHHEQGGLGQQRPHLVGVAAPQSASASSSPTKTRSARRGEVAQAPRRGIRRRPEGGAVVDVEAHGHAGGAATASNSASTSASQIAESAGVMPLRCSEPRAGRAEAPAGTAGPCARPRSPRGSSARRGPGP